MESYCDISVYFIPPTGTDFQKKSLRQGKFHTFAGNL